jgi:hypothetical protein
MNDAADDDEPLWMVQDRARAAARETAYRLQHPGHVSGEPTMMLRVVIGGSTGSVPYVKWDGESTRRPPIGRYACFWIGD